MFPVVGYVTLVTSEIPLLDCPPEIRKRISNKTRLPALLLARMGVDTAHQGNDLGEYLVKFALHQAWLLNQMSGCFLLVVDAKDEESKRFYLRYGFKALPQTPLRLIMPMATIAKLFE